MEVTVVIILRERRTDPGPASGVWEEVTDHLGRHRLRRLSGQKQDHKAGRVGSNGPSRPPLDQ